MALRSYAASCCKQIINKLCPVVNEACYHPYGFSRTWDKETNRYEYVCILHLFLTWKDYSYCHDTEVWGSLHLLWSTRYGLDICWMPDRNPNSPQSLNPYWYLTD